jgi:hypothetical protein
VPADCREGSEAAPTLSYSRDVAVVEAAAAFARV